MLGDEYQLKEQLKVAALIEKLKGADPSLPVVTEGCDCDGYMCDVEIQDDRVYITRGAGG